MIAGILILVAFVIAGCLTGLNIIVPYSYSKYIAVAILACLDSVFGAFSANLSKKFKINIFLSGFFGNALIAMFLVFIGDKLNVDIYLAAVIVFSGRILNNFANIRRELVDKIHLKPEKKLEDTIEDKAKDIKQKRLKNINKIKNKDTVETEVENENNEQI